jgi:segregation and condensation protein B
MDYLIKHVEALIFCANEPITVSEIQKCLHEMFESEIPETDISSAIIALQEKYTPDDFVFNIVPVAGGYQFLTKPAYQNSISVLLKQKNKKRLSTAALETLSIIAYKQPITKSDIEAIRGVNCDYSIQKLLEKELIIISGRNETMVGKPLIYSTSRHFMDYFGINSSDELPKISEVLAEQIVTPTLVNAEHFETDATADTVDNTQAADGDTSSEITEEDTSFNLPA